MKYLGDCEVCGAKVPTYRSLGQHLRHNTDVLHKELKDRWRAWRGEYRTSRCRKCGRVWVTDVSQVHAKRCPDCEAAKGRMTRREYEAWRPSKKPDPRSTWCKSHWTGLDDRTRRPDDLVKQQIVKGVEDGVLINDLRRRLGVSYKVLKKVAEAEFGRERFAALMRQRKVESARRMVMQAQTCSGLEETLVQSLAALGIPTVGRNAWLTLTVDGVRTHREIDVKVEAPSGHKVAVLCDGEAFHGPEAFYVDPARRIADDVATAEALFGLGYSVCRYSESEIHSGWAAAHLKAVLPKVGDNHRLLRLWHPAEEGWG